jgi:hypothetical protein
MPTKDLAMMELRLKCSPDMEKLVQESFKAQQKTFLSDGFRKILGVVISCTDNQGDYIKSKLCLTKV